MKERRKHCGKSDVGPRKIWNGDSATFVFISLQGRNPTGEVCVAPVCHHLHHALVLHSAGALPVSFIADGLGEAEEAWPWTV